MDLQWFLSIALDSQLLVLMLTFLYVSFLNILESLLLDISFSDFLLWVESKRFALVTVCHPFTPDDHSIHWSWFLMKMASMLIILSFVPVCWRWFFCLPNWCSRYFENNAGENFQGISDVEKLSRSQRNRVMLESLLSCTLIFDVCFSVTILEDYFEGDSKLILYYTFPYLFNFDVHDMCLISWVASFAINHAVCLLVSRFLFSLATLFHSSFSSSEVTINSVLSA